MRRLNSTMRRCALVAALVALAVGAQRLTMAAGEYAAGRTDDSIQSAAPSAKGFASYSLVADEPAAGGAASAKPADAAKRLAILFLGDGGHHEPAKRFESIKPVLAARGVDVTYTAEAKDLTKENLAKYDGVLIYRDSGDLPAANEQALREFVESGKGVIPLHCASHTFRNSSWYTQLVGGRFLKHETGEFRARIIDAQHPAMRGVKSFESWDETYVHNELGKDIRVLMTRVRDDGGYEPWTWVRKQGKGRVYYTASGHDDRTWRNPAFHQLLESGIRWACGLLNDDVPATEYMPAGEGLPNYVAGEKWGTEADRVMKMPKPLDAKTSMRHMHTPEGFHVELFATEPQIVKPIAMNFDNRGRCWIIESVDYPNKLLDEPHLHGNDRIKICEDTDGDGKADKFTVFADNINIPTSILPYGDGALVMISPYLVYFRDTNGDGVADERKIILSGFGRGDTHAVASNLHLGMDNWIWAVSGYSGGDVRQGENGKRLAQRFGQCVFRFKPDGSALEVVAPTSNNTWGLGMNEMGDIFASTANNDHSVFIGLPNRIYENVRGWHGVGSASIADHERFHPIADDVRQMDWHGKFTAASGHEIYTAGQFPAEYRNRAAFVCEPTGHLIHLNWLVPDGSGYIARDGYNFFASTDPWTSPIAAQVGPDGSLWFLDWYNYIIQHNPTPNGFKTGRGAAYETTLRDKEHGRIYRVVYGTPEKQEPMNLAKASQDELVAALGDDNMFWRMQAQAGLLASGKMDKDWKYRIEYVEALDQFIGKPGDEWRLPHLINLMRESVAQDNETKSDQTRSKETGKTKGSAYETFIGTDFELLNRAVLGALPHEQASVAIALKGLEKKSPRVRLAALVALTELPADAAAGKAIAKLLAGKRSDLDRFTLDAATAAAANGGAEFIVAASGETRLAADAPLVQVVRIVAEHVARGGQVEALDRIVPAIATASPAICEATIAGFAKGWPADKKYEVTDARAEALGKVLARISPASQLELVGLAKRWGAIERFAALTRDLTKTLAKQVGDETVDEAGRLQAAKQLVATGDSGAADAVLAAITPKTSPELAAGFMEALGEGKSDSIGAAIVGRLGDLTPAPRRSALAALLRRAAWCNALLDAAEKKTVSLDDLALDQRQLLAQHPNEEVAKRAAKLLSQSGGLPNPDRQKLVEKFLPVAKTAGDAVAGKKLFVDNCAKCHKHSGEGATIGPDLTGMAAHPKSEIIVHVLDPNRSVEGNYRQHQVMTEDGEVFSGLLVAETRTAVELVDAEAKRHVILREEIDRMTASKMSLMPEGFEKLGEKGLTDLLEFLSAKGKYFPLPLNKAANVVSTKGGMFQGDNLDYEKLVFKTWGQQVADGIPFQVIDPLGERIANAIVLYGPRTKVVQQYPKTVTVPCNAPAKTIHLLSGVSGWGFPFDSRQTVSMIVRLHYAGGATEDHKLVNGKHFADFAGATNVPDSKLAFRLRGQQIRHVVVTPEKKDVIEKVEFVKGDDTTSPVVMAVTVEAP